MNSIKWFGSISIIIGFLLLIISNFCIRGANIEIYKNIYMMIFLISWLSGFALLEIGSQIDKHSKHFTVVEIRLENIEELIKSFKEKREKGE
mgnify:CR=1 FL=1